MLSETDDGIHISAIDPAELMTGDQFRELAAEAAGRLARALASVPTKASELD